MAEKKQEQKKQTEKSEKSQQAHKKQPQHEETNEVIVRLFGYDVRGSKNIYTGLTKIKGISWAIANAVCVKLGIQRNKKISELSKDEIKKIEDFLVSLDVPDFMKNRRLDIETGKTSHLYGADLEITKEFDIKRLKKIKSYKGIRHSFRLPVRGQRTKSHFRTRENKSKVKKVKKEEK